MWNQRLTITDRLRLSVLFWQQVALCIIFGLLLLLVIVGCTLSPSPFVSVALVLALAIGVGAVLRPRFALLLVFIGAGLPSLVLPLPGHTMRPIEPALFLCLAIIFFWRPYLRLRLPHLLALLFMAIAIISFIHVPEISTNLNVYAADKQLFGLILTFIAFFCGTFLVKYVKDASSFLVTVLLANIPLYLIGLAQALSIHVPSLLEASGAQDPAQTQGRLWGPFPWSVTFGGYLTNLFAVALATWLLGARRRDRIIGAIMMIATALELVGSGTRSAAAAAVILVAVSFIVTRRFRMLCGVIALSGLTTVVFFNKIISLFAHDPASTSTRFYLWQEAIKLIITHPWIGIGLQQFRIYYAQLIVSQATVLNPNGIHPHNQYLELAMESGIAWLIVYVLLLLSIIYSCWQAYRIAQRGQQVLLLAAILAVLANMAIGFVDATMGQVEGTVFLFLLAGLALGYAERIRWGVPGESVAVPISPSLPPQAVNATGIGRRLYRPFPRRPGMNPSPTESPSSHTTVISATDAAPNAQKTSRTIVIQLLFWGIAIPLTFPATALLARYLGPTQYGEYSFMFTFLTVFALLSFTGMDPLIIRQLSRQFRTKWSNTLSYAAGTRLLTTAFSAGAAASLALVLPISSEQRNLLLLGSVSLFFSFSANCLKMIYTLGFQAEQRVSILSLIETTNRLVTAGLVALVVLLRLPLLLACALIIYSDLPFFLILVLITRRRYGIRIRFSLARVRELVFGSLSLTGNDALGLFAGQASILLLIMLTGPLSVGIYALAMRITTPLLSIVVAYVTGLYPLLCTKFEEGREQFGMVHREAVRVLALAIIPLAIFVSAEANAIVMLLGGVHFAAAASVVQLLMWAVAAGCFSYLTVSFCMAANLERWIPYVTVVSVSVNVLANLMLIPHWQFIGAGVAALLSEMSALCLFSLLLARHVRPLLAISVVLRVLLGNLPMLAFLLWQQQLPLLVAPLAFLLAIAGCMATRTLSLKDVHMVGSILSTWRGKETGKDVTDQPTILLPRIQDVTDWPTTILPRVQI